MTLNQKKKNIEIVIDKLKQLYPNVKIQLNFETPFQLLVATILSAQCTDERVNIVTSYLFQEYKNPDDFANMHLNRLEKLIYSTGYYKAKSRNIKKMSRMLVEKFNGGVPDNLDELIELPGVGRKTANVILGHIYDTPAVVVDTHVTRIINRLGFCSTKNAVKIEYELMEITDSKYWVILTHYLINFGRQICSSRSPKCCDCPLSNICQYYKTSNQKKN